MNKVAQVIEEVTKAVCTDTNVKEATDNFRKTVNGMPQEEYNKLFTDDNSYLEEGITAAGDVLRSVKKLFEYVKKVRG